MIRRLDQHVANALREAEMTPDAGRWSGAHHDYCRVENRSSHRAHIPEAARSTRAPATSLPALFRNDALLLCLFGMAMFLAGVLARGLFAGAQP